MTQPDRRTVLKLMAAAGLSPLAGTVLGAAESDEGLAVTGEMIADADWLAGMDFT